MRRILLGLVRQARPSCIYEVAWLVEQRSRKVFQNSNKQNPTDVFNATYCSQTYGHFALCNLATWQHFETSFAWFVGLWRTANTMRVRVESWVGPSSFNWPRILQPRDCADLIDRLQRKYGDCEIQDGEFRDSRFVRVDPVGYACGKRVVDIMLDDMFGKQHIVSIDHKASGVVQQLAGRLGHTDFQVVYADQMWTALDDSNLAASRFLCLPNKHFDVVRCVEMSMDGLAFDVVVYSDDTLADLQDRMCKLVRQKLEVIGFRIGKPACLADIVAYKRALFQKDVPSADQAVPCGGGGGGGGGGLEQAFRK